MTYDTTSARDGAGPFGANRFGPNGDDWFGWARRPGFHPGKLLAVIAGFAIFPPLGIAALVFFLWSSRRAYWAAQGDGQRWRGGCGMRRLGTGNQAFDDHRAKVLEELEAERNAFAAYRKEERMKKDRAEFEAFQASHGKSED